MFLHFPYICSVTSCDGSGCFDIRTTFSNPSLVWNIFSGPQSGRKGKIILRTNQFSIEGAVMGLCHSRVRWLTVVWGRGGTRRFLLSPLRLVRKSCNYGLWEEGKWKRLGGLFSYQCVLGSTHRRALQTASYCSSNCACIMMRVKPAFAFRMAEW